MPYSLQRVMAGLLIVALSVPMTVIAAAIRILDGGPVIFRQERAGRKARPFVLLKFRTMKNNADDMLISGKDPKRRLTRTGAFLRKSGLDELPQLLNVVRGDMALVGPRAMLLELAERVPGIYHQRFNVFPGITGLAQVSGRNSIPWSRRLELDVEYARSRSIGLDTGIALRTLVVLVRGSGHSPDRNTNQVDDLGLMGVDNG